LQGGWGRIGKRSPNRERKRAGEYYGRKTLPFARMDPRWRGEQKRRAQGVERQEKKKESISLPLPTTLTSTEVSKKMSQIARRKGGTLQKGLLHTGDVLEDTITAPEGRDPPFTKLLRNKKMGNKVSSTGKSEEGANKVKARKAGERKRKNQNSRTNYVEGIYQCLGMWEKGSQVVREENNIGGYRPQ